MRMRATSLRRSDYEICMRQIVHRQTASPSHFCIENTHACDLSIRHTDYEARKRVAGSAGMTVFLAYLGWGIATRLPLGLDKNDFAWG